MLLALEHPPHRSLGIHLFCLPLNTTHLLQPLNIGAFGPVKTAWRMILKQPKVRTRAANVTRYIFPSLIKKLWDTAVKPVHLQGGFRSAGLAPFHPTVVPSDRLAPSPVTQRQVSQTPPRSLQQADIVVIAIIHHFDDSNQHFADWRPEFCRFNQCLSRRISHLNKGSRH